MSRLVWDWTTAAFAKLAVSPPSCDLDPSPRLRRILEVAKELGVLPTDVLTVSDHMARDVVTGEVKLWAKPMRQPGQSFNCPEPEARHDELPPRQRGVPLTKCGHPILKPRQARRESRQRDKARQATQSPPHPEKPTATADRPRRKPAPKCGPSAQPRTGKSHQP
jgi:hypothetical protein